MMTRGYHTLTIICTIVCTFEPHGSGAKAVSSTGVDKSGRRLFSLLSGALIMVRCCTRRGGFTHAVRITLCTV